MLMVRADAFMAPSRAFVASVHAHKSAPKVTVLAAKARSKKDAPAEDAPPTDEAEAEQINEKKSETIEEPAHAPIAAAPAAVPVAVDSVLDGYGYPAKPKKSFADANPTPDPRTGKPKDYKAITGFFSKAPVGDSRPEPSDAHVRSKPASFAEQFPTTPAGIVNPSPKAFAQAHPVLLAGVVDPAADPSKAEAAFQAVYAPPKFNNDKPKSFAEAFPCTPAAVSKLPQSSFAYQYPTTLSGLTSRSAANPSAYAGDLPNPVAGARAPKVSFAATFPTTPAGQSNPSPKSFAQKHPTTHKGLMAGDSGAEYAAAKAPAAEAMAPYTTMSRSKKKTSFAELYPTTPAGQSNPSPKSFAQNHPTTQTGNI